VLGPAFTINSFTVRIQTPPGAGNTYTFSLRKAGGPDYSGANCQITGNATSCNFTVGGVATGVGDGLDWEMKRSSSSVPAPGWVFWQIQYS
jgi:hypothetical protein